MLDAEARMLLDLMEKAAQDGAEAQHAALRRDARRSTMSEDSEADPPQVGEAIDGDFARPGRQDPLPPLPAAGRGGGPVPTLIYHHAAAS